MTKEKQYGKDYLGIISKHMTPKQVDQAHDNWDMYYGIYPYDFEVYVLLDSTKRDKYIFGPLEFNYEPFYVGYGKIGRHRKSMALGRQKDKYTFKVERMIEIDSKGGSIRPQVVNRFYTRKKAMLVEKKLMNIIPRGYLENSNLSFCKVPLLAADYAPMQNHTMILTT